MDSQKSQAALVLGTLGFTLGTLALSSCQKLPPVEEHDWGHGEAAQLAAESEELQPDILRAKRKLAEERRSASWPTKIAEASRVGITATSDGGAGPVFTVDLMKLTRSDETPAEAKARLYQLRKQHKIKVEAAKRRVDLSKRQSKAQAAHVAAAKEELSTSRDLLKTGDLRQHDVLKLEAQLLAANNAYEEAKETEQAALDELEALTLLERERLR